MKNIIVPVNFSANSNNAALYAADLALAVDADIHLIYVLQLPPTTSEIPMTDYVFDEMQRNGELSLASLSEEIVKRTRLQVKVTSLMEIGSVEPVLEEYCNRLKPFLVVMGATGNTLETTIAGSTTVKAMRRLPYPLLIVPEQAAFHAIKKVVLACELEDIGAGLPVSRSFLSELYQLFGSRFDVITVTGEVQESEAEAVSAFDSWKESIKDILPDVHILRMESIEEGINNYLNRIHADWLMIFPKKHRFFEFHSSRSKKIIKDCPVPVMTLHAIDQ
ncbi:MAG TPA: universal stress protein [Puia sp.]|jgi:nucleotide-binding universal stress UspA family protein|nr:universal stress protein [Puia sp.]